MKKEIFYIVVIIICLVGMISTGLLIKYTIDLSKNVSITSYISNEE